MNTYYPVYIELRGQPCVVIGGGRIAEGKVDGLLAVKAMVRVVSPDLRAHLQDLVSQNQIDYLPREYRRGDLTGAFMVICATDRPDINHQVWQEATANRQLVNVVDDTPRCNFIAPAIVRKGDLTVAISTAGKAPALAVRLKQQLQNELGPEYPRFLDLAGQLREHLARNVPDFEMRRELWYELVDSNVLELLSQGDEAGALQAISRTIGFHFQPA